jgi:hypothetical protein
MTRKPKTPPKKPDVSPLVVDAFSVAIESRSLAWERNESARRVQVALDRVARFVETARADTADGHAVATCDWRNLFAVVTEGLEAASRRDALDAAQTALRNATAALPDADTEEGQEGPQGRAEVSR